MSSNTSPTQESLVVNSNSNVLETTVIQRSPDIAISICGIGKMYRIYSQPQDRLKQMLWRGHRNYGREFWALRDVSFDVRRGETLGIIGRNGSGKSTLLQIIAGTLAPTEGEVSISGRVAALLELGSGFNPDFTGRENVFLNGSILGLSRTEMEMRFDDIAAFADIGDFIEQPVKLYSSGMLVRLAFAVQAQVQPDILIVDEALAVGDFAFQHKCMSKISSLQDDGVSILLVSHDTAAIKAHCSNAVMLEQGRIFSVGHPDKVTVDYYRRVIDQERGISELDSLINSEVQETDVPKLMEVSEMMLIEPSVRWGIGGIRYEGIKVTNIYGIPTNTFDFQDWISIELLLRAEQNIEHSFPGLLVKDLYGNYITGVTTWSLGQVIPPLQKGQIHRVAFDIQLLYRPGNYSIVINNCVDNLGTDFYDWCDNVAQFTIVEGDYMQPKYGYGLFSPPAKARILTES